MKRLVVTIAFASMLIVSGCAAGSDSPPAEEVASDSMTAESMDPAVVDPDHYSVEFENDIVRVLRIRYGPGEESVMHSHPAGCGIVLEAGTFSFTTDSDQVFTEETVAETVNCSDAEVHQPRNMGDTEAEFVFFDIKGLETFEDAVPNDSNSPAAGTPASGSGVPDALSADLDHYSVEYENRVVRILRARYGVGEASVLHSHPANCAIYLTGGTFRFTSESGEVTTRERERGQVSCGNGSVHLPENIGTVDEDIIVMEMKGRQELVQ